MKNNVNGFICRLHMAKKKISELEDNLIKKPKTINKKDKRWKKQNIQKLWDANNKRCNIGIMKISGEETENTSNNDS